MEPTMNAALDGISKSGIRVFTQMAKQEPGCLFLTLGEPDFDTPASIREAAKASLDAGDTHYPENNGQPFLRQAIARFEQEKHGLSYKVSNKTIVIVKAEAQAPVKQRKTKKISGVITDETGLPVAGANIVVKGTTNGTISDMDGNFSLEAAPGEMLEISYIGFLPMEVKIDNKNTFDILMKEDAQGLDEVVVIGYGTVKKRDLTGAVASVNAAKISAVPTSTASEALQGRIPGVECRFCLAGESAGGSGVYGFGETR
mgnify:CR=1 FL=1